MQATSWEDSYDRAVAFAGRLWDAAGRNDRSTFERLAGPPGPNVTWFDHRTDPERIDRLSFDYVQAVASRCTRTSHHEEVLSLDPVTVNFRIDCAGRPATVSIAWEEDGLRWVSLGDAPQY